MKNMKRIVSICVLLSVLVAAAIGINMYGMETRGTFWALFPPVVAIYLALVTKEVYSSLFAGIVAGSLLWSKFSFVGTVRHVFEDGLLGVLADASNVSVLVFLVILGMIIVLIQKAGGADAFALWASGHIKNRRMAELSTMFLGMGIFVDGYFNCLTVGTVMRPVTDKYRVSREKLAYLIDSTAAPVCILAPISSWSAAVSGFVEGKNGLQLFIEAIPYNFYAILTLWFMFLLICMEFDYGSMDIYEKQALAKKEKKIDEAEVVTEGNVVDMLFPIIVLIISCITAMLYTGGFWDGADFISAFGRSNSSFALVMGGFITLLFTVSFYLLRGSLDFFSCMECLPEGFNQMVPALLIMAFALALKFVTDSLGAPGFVADFVALHAGGFQTFMPALIFLIAMGLSFATGTSWGTFGILIPIVVVCFENINPGLMIISISACLAGAVFGDHCSPISDTSIMSSVGAGCNHLEHVRTQLPYALTVAVVSFGCYLWAGAGGGAVLPLLCGMLVLFLFLTYLRRRSRGKSLAGLKK